MRSHIQFSAAKNYFLGLATSGAVLVSGLVYFNSKDKKQDLPSNVEKVNYIAAETPRLQNFDPNFLSAEEWRSLGFSEKQVGTILKYKDVVGGAFKSKEQLKKCYAISPEKFSQLEPYIQLPETSSSSYRNFAGNSSSYRSYSNSYSTGKKLNIPGKFNPDEFGVEDFVKMGFSERQSESILKYKNYLGGSFQSKEKLKACFMISAENYRQMEPYILLPEKAAEKFQPKTFAKNEKAAFRYEPFEPNLTDLEGWKKLGFSPRQAQVIINYRDRNLKGSFKNLEDIERCFVISPEKFAEMKPFIVLNPENYSRKPAENYSSVTSQNYSQEKTDFSKVDINQITFKQLIEFGFDEKSAAMLLGFRKKLGGFVNKQQIVETYDIDRNVAEKLIYTAKLDDSKVAKYTLVDAPETWLKSHPYFKYSADKIIYYRLTNPDDRKIWKFLRVKPEYETRMKLYLKKD